MLRGQQGWEQHFGLRSEPEASGRTARLRWGVWAQRGGGWKGRPGGQPAGVTAERWRLFWKGMSREAKLQGAEGRCGWRREAGPPHPPGSPFESPDFRQPLGPPGCCPLAQHQPPQGVTVMRPSVLQCSFDKPERCPEPFQTQPKPTALFLPPSLPKHLVFLQGEVSWIVVALRLLCGRKSPRMASIPRLAWPPLPAQSRRWPRADAALGFSIRGPQPQGQPEALLPGSCLPQASPDLDGRSSAANRWGPGFPDRVGPGQEAERGELPVSLGLWGPSFQPPMQFSWTGPGETDTTTQSSAPWFSPKTPTEWPILAPPCPSGCSPPASPL